MMINPGSMVLVRWRDACAYAMDEVPKENAYDCEDMGWESVGFLIRMDRSVVSITASRSDKTCRCVEVIPRRMVVDVQVLAPRKKLASRRSIGHNGKKLHGKAEA